MFDNTERMSERCSVTVGESPTHELMVWMQCRSEERVRERWIGVYDM